VGKFIRTRSELPTDLHRFSQIVVLLYAIGERDRNTGSYIADCAFDSIQSKRGKHEPLPFRETLIGLP
jgi:hypothetical protein